MDNSAISELLRGLDERWGTAVLAYGEMDNTTSEALSIAWPNAVQAPPAKRRFREATTLGADALIVRDLEIRETHDLIVALELGYVVFAAVAASQWEDVLRAIKTFSAALGWTPRILSAHFPFVLGVPDAALLSPFPRDGLANDSRGR